MDYFFLLLVFLVSAGATGLMRLYAVKVSLLDVPNHRSSHTVSTPRGGGLGFAAVFLVSVLVLFLFSDLETELFLSLFVGGLLVAGIGFLDDHHHVPASRRLLVQLFAAVFMLVLLGGLPEIPFGQRTIDLGIAGDTAAVLFVVWLINLYNFMDGIDGIAAVQTLSVVIGAFVMTTGQSAGDVSLLLTCFGASVAGFLVWNWPPAKIFMGDVGSGFLGFSLATMAIVSISAGWLSIWVWLILSGVFLVDATQTLLVRVMHGQRWYLPHNSHAYQQAARRFNSHRAVTTAVLLINVAWLFPIAWLAAKTPESGWWLTCVALVPLILLATFFRAGRADTET